jgi:hypothetical protein
MPWVLDFVFQANDYQSTHQSTTTVIVPKAARIGNYINPAIHLTFVAQFHGFVKVYNKKL